jgi:hypothetical protein
LKNGEAEGYQGITLEYIGGKEPTLTIYHGQARQEDKVVEVINLRPYDTNEQLHELLTSKGFVPKSLEERERIRHDNMQQIRLEQEKKDLFRVRTRIYYEKEKYFVERFQMDVMGGMMIDTEELTARGGRDASYYLKENYRRIYATEYFEFTGNRPLQEDIVKALARKVAASSSSSLV